MAFSEFRCLTTTLIFLLLSHPSTPLEFNFPSMIHPNPSLTTEGNATYLDSNQLRLTANKTDQIGRVRYAENLRLWESSTGESKEADFTTEFSFSVHSTDRAPGDGIAFFLAQPPFLLPSVTDGSAIGLVGHEELNKSAYPFVAVEFDTFPNDFDPPDRRAHVGVNVNSLVSNKTTPWGCDIQSMHVYNATVSYVARSRNLSVTFTGYFEKVRVEESLHFEIRLSEHLPEWVSFGFSSANGLFTSTHILRSWSFKSNLDAVEHVAVQPSERSNNSVQKLAIGVSIAGGLCAFFVVGLAILVVLWKKAKKKRKNSIDFGDNKHSVFDESMEEEFEKSAGARRFSYEELLAATNNFSEEEKLGEGGFGDVYRGFLKSSNSLVAIKRVSKWSSQGIKEYAAEVKIVSRLRHKNLVQLIGYCHARSNLLLVYDFMPNDTLDSRLFPFDASETPFPWDARYHVAKGLASALRYLHEECEECVLHRDVKPSNVMLDSELNAKLGDFGLARLVRHGKGAQTTVLAGTLGYLAPECVMTGRASRESDVYGFGVVALEIACGKRAIEDEHGLVDWVWELHHESGRILDSADPRLSGRFDSEQMVRLLLVGLWCSHPDWGLRPSMKEASHVLDFQAPVPIFPAYSSPAWKFGHGNKSSTTTTTSTTTSGTRTKSSDSSSEASQFTDIAR